MQLSVRTTDRVILQYGELLGDLPGSVIEDVTDNIAGRILSALSQPNGGVTISPDHATVTPRPVPPPPPPDPSVIAAQQQRLAAVATALNNGTAYLDPALIPNPTAAQQAGAQQQRDAWAAILQVKPLTIPVTQKATAADIHPL